MNNERFDDRLIEVLEELARAERECEPTRQVSARMKQRIEAEFALRHRLEPRRPLLDRLGLTGWRLGFAAAGMATLLAVISFFSISPISRSTAVPGSGAGQAIPDSAASSDAGTVVGISAQSGQAEVNPDDRSSGRWRVRGYAVEDESIFDYDQFDFQDTEYLFHVRLSDVDLALPGLAGNGDVADHEPDQEPDHNVNAEVLMADDGLVRAVRLYPNYQRKSVTTLRF